MTRICWIADTKLYPYVPIKLVEVSDNIRMKFDDD